jgi:hypothetical protein
MKSWKTPTPEQIDRAVGLLVHAEQYRYFFDRLENPEWIEPLRSKKFFLNPPKPRHDKERGTIGFPLWPESQYLVRMASLKPDLVSEIILQIPDTENVRVYEDLGNAALRMPPESAVRLLEKAKTWAHSPNQLLLPEKLGALAAHLAKGGKVDEALELARVILEVLPDPRSDREPTEKAYGFLPEPRARFEIWDYEQILKKHFIELVMVTGIRALALLCDLLETAIRLSSRRHADESPEDHSYIWRPAVEEHAENSSLDIKGVLVSGIRDAAESLAKSDRASVEGLVRLLEGRSWCIFHRIALHLLRRFPDAAPELVAARLINRTLFNDSRMRHEFALLVGECFGRLTAEQQHVMLDWIEAGPDLQEFKEAQEQWTGKRPTDEDMTSYRKIWQRDRLALFKTQLTAAWKQRYEALVTECGEPQHPEFMSWVGPTSPKSAEELKAMAVADIVEFLVGWKPPEDAMAPSPEGLGRVISSVISQEPGRFALEARRFQGLDPSYVRALFFGLRDSRKESRTFEWPPVFALCQWVVSQSREIPGRKSRTLDADPDWGWTRKAIADLLSVGFEDRTGSIPIEQRTTAWEILLPLTNDPEPTQEYEATYGGSNMDAATLSINTTRGEAMHAVVQYALWVRRSLEKLQDANQRLGRGFDEMQEVRTILDEHLKVSSDRSLAIRSLYGQWFPWLVLLDPAWAQDRVTQIFPVSESEHAFRDAAWETYISFCAPYNYVFEILGEEYNFAVEHLGEHKDEKRGLAEPDKRLAAHLMTFYWRGKIDLDNPNGHLNKFWLKGSDKLKGYALSFVGQALRQTRDTIPSEIVSRLKRLWENRLAAAKCAPAPDSHNDELAAFGWWFVSEKFDDQWAIAHLMEALKIAGKTDPDHLVVERLAALAHGRSLETVQCLEAIVKGDRAGWAIYSWREEARTILAVALQDSKTRAAAENIIDYLGSRGYFEFRDLL